MNAINLAIFCMPITIHLAADHAGFALKERVKTYLERRGFVVRDHGAGRLIAGDDYPDYMIPAAEAVARTKGVGVFFGGSGLGECIAANKVRGVRAAAAYDAYTARMSRVDNDANVLCFGSRTSVGKSWTSVRRILDVWLGTKFSGTVRHRRRLRKIARYEAC